MTRLTGKIAVVSGAANGPTARIAARLAAEGAAVVLNDAADSEGAVRVAAGIVRRGGRAIAVQGDVSKAQDVRRVFRAAVEIFGRPDIVVNNAGIFRVEPIEVPDDADRAFAVNVFGTFLMCQEAARQFDGRGGIIINMSSAENSGAMPDDDTQSTIKGAIDMLTLGLASDFASRGIRVVSIDPASFDTLDLSDDERPGRSARHLSGLLHHRARLSCSRALPGTGDVAFIRNELVASTGWRGW
ncbi:MAG TPA: SDR family NAD(P)-dependent oxidoreductase [Pararhizobium sp.]|uniref:SDR family NAD(P)-dependent oxidoreductase n=1 Tax=Pararhizobium sp. TaxID=1977563 RepID=UPI002B97E385|nr:SDR family NAD(P)-dependent oxidoreductase [Pararhizobium sp.]HTO33894.1 SDR family NAD(P)-dependent oxidoreductase [Pararhizobium sp.]